MCGMQLARPLVAAHIIVLIGAALTSIPAKPLLADQPPASHPAPASGSASAGENRPFVHPGLLHNDEDFRRMAAAVHAGQDPWTSGWNKLTANNHAQVAYRPRPVAIVVRGHSVEPENYGQLFNDIAAAYACAVRWRISGDRAYAVKAVEILNAWSATLTEIHGSSDRFLATGIYGYEIANAAEIMRTFDGWKPEDFHRFQQMMLRVFYPMNKDFLARHNGTAVDHYWANWDLCNMASAMAIGVLCDDRSIYNEAVEYFKTGAGNGSLKNVVVYVHPGGLGQWQEAGRDQGHTTMGIGLMGALCEMAWKQGDDLYGYDDNCFLAGCEYVAKYNLGEDVPFQAVVIDKKQYTAVNSSARGNIRPVWALVYNHYVKRKGLPAPYTTKMMKHVAPEGGGGDYGPNSGGFDQLGYGTLTCTLP